MTIEDKVRFGLVALSGTALVLTSLGIHVSPLEQMIHGAGEL